MMLPRIDVYTCYAKTKLIFAGGSRAVITAPQQFITLACNNASYQKVVAGAFQKCCGQALTPRAVLAGSAEEAEARAEVDAALHAPVTAPPISQALAPKTEPAPAIREPNDGYQKIDKSDIPEGDLKNPLLAAALKIAPDCDIYEKK